MRQHTLELIFASVCITSVIPMSRKIYFQEITYFWLVKACEHMNGKEKNNNGNLNHKTVCMKHFYDHQQDTQYNY